MSPAAKFAKLSHVDAERHQAGLVLATERRGNVRGIGVFATFMIPGREQMSKGTSMKKDQKKPKKKR